MAINTAKQVLESEARAISRMTARLDGRFKAAVQLIQKTKGRVVLIGMGKPGYIAQKISASLASTGTQSFSLHPADALHGDLGRMMRKDVVLILSNSGETEEIVQLLPLIRAIGCKVIAMTGNLRSKLARASHVVLDTSVESEAAPLNVAPTTSTTCMLALGDALTMALVKKRRFREHDFAMLHPGGSLGKKLHMKVQNVMRKGKTNPCVRPETSIKQVLLKITQARSGSVTVVDTKRRCLGIFTDGDLRRHFTEITRKPNAPVSQFMTRRPITVQEKQLAVKAIEIFKQRQVDELPVVNAKGKVTGLLDIQDLIKQGFVLSNEDG